MITITNLFYPPVCGICGKLNEDFLCKKCEKLLESQSKFEIQENTNTEVDYLVNLGSVSFDTELINYEYNYDDQHHHNTKSTVMGFNNYMPTIVSSKTGELGISVLPQTIEGQTGSYNDFNGITSKFGAHFILKIENILLKEKYYDAIVNGVTNKNFCPLPTNWGYRDSKYFWCSDYEKPIAIGIPNREIDLSSVKYALDRIDTDVKFTDDALKMIVKVPRPFLKTVLLACIKWADENNCKLITEEEMKIINDKRSKEKERK